MLSVVPRRPWRYAESVNPFRHLAARLIGAMLVIVALAMPAAAMDAHAISHMASPIDATEHHHHDEDGGIVADHDHDDEAPGDRDNGGHEHMPVHVITFEAPVAPAFEATAFLGSPLKSIIARDRAPPDLSLDPDNRPPRSI